MLKVGLTGGIGSGKTTVAQLFEVLGIPVYYADDRAKRLMVEDPALIEGIKSLFGPESYQADGALHRAFIARQAFSEPSLLKQLEALVHPAVFADGNRWHEAQSGAPYTLKEAALLFESGGYKELDKVITVSAPLELRIARVIRRDQTTREAVEARIRQQMTDEEKMRLADFVIFNDGAHSLIEQVWSIHQQLLIQLSHGAHS
ncbi:MAG: dephospho-CoA kinase [Saprospirales bacterium]|nr:dephospho-CoA kinase [Saprospirales bacterium]